MPVSPEQTAETLRRRSAAERAARDALANTLRLRVMARVRAALPVGGRAWLIGSLAWGDFGERSDIDIVTEGWPPTARLSLENDLARSTDREVDCLAWEDLSPTFRARVEREGTALHGP